MTAHDVALAIEDLCTRTGRPQPRRGQIRTRPAAMFAAISTHLDPTGFASLHENNFTDAVDDVVPCGRPGCDGHGWINLTPIGLPVTTKCPHCPPAIRAYTPPEIHEPGWDTEPPF